MAAPTLVGYQESNWTDTALGDEVTPSQSWQVDDLVVVLGMTSDQALTLGTPTVTGLTFSALAGSPSTGVSSCKGYGWSATGAGTASGAISASKAGGPGAGIASWVFRDHGGIGGGVIGSGSGFTANITVVGPDSTVVMALGDWNATTDVTVTTVPAGGTIRESSRVEGQLASVVIEWTGQAAGTRAYGVADWTGTAEITKIGYEIKGTSGGPPVTVTPARVNGATAVPGPTVQAGEVLTFTAVTATGWTATGGTPVGVLGDTDAGTYLTSVANPTGEIIDGTLPPAEPPVGDVVVTVSAGRIGGSTSSLAVTLRDGGSLAATATVTGAPADGAPGDVVATFAAADLVGVAAGTWRAGTLVVRTAASAS